MSMSDVVNLLVGFVIGYFILAHYAAAARPA